MCVILLVITNLAVADLNQVGQPAKLEEGFDLDHKSHTYLSLIHLAAVTWLPTSRKFDFEDQGQLH